MNNIDEKIKELENLITLLKEEVEDLRFELRKLENEVYDD